MDAYTSFAKVYDTFMDDVPYQDWCDYIMKLLSSHHITQGLMLDLGCGTGSLTQLLSQNGFDMIALDNSPDMLEIAREKALEAQQDILYLLQDMREFELYGTVAAIISVCDSINYVTDSSELTQVFSLVNNYLDPKGIFIFDFHPEQYYRTQLADHIFAEDRGTLSIIWDNYYDEASRINEYQLSLFMQSEENSATYYKYEETHYQRGYTLEEIKACIEASGLDFLCAYDAFTQNPPSEDSERIYIIAQEKGK